MRGVVWHASHCLCGLQAAGRYWAGHRWYVVGRLGLEDAARHLGRSSIETTRVYAKWADTSQQCT